MLATYGRAVAAAGTPAEDEPVSAGVPAQRSADPGHTPANKERNKYEAFCHVGWQRAWSRPSVGAMIELEG